MFDVKRMGKQIAHLRTGSSYTQEQLAEILNVSPQAVSKWENGKAIPEIPILCGLSELFHCSIDSILDPSAWSLRDMDFDYEFLIKPRVPAADSLDWSSAGTAKTVRSMMMKSIFCSRR